MEITLRRLVIIVYAILSRLGYWANLSGREQINETLIRKRKIFLSLKLTLVLISSRCTQRCACACLKIPPQPPPPPPLWFPSLYSKLNSTNLHSTPPPLPISCKLIFFPAPFKVKNLYFNLVIAKRLLNYLKQLKIVKEKKYFTQFHLMSTLTIKDYITSSSLLKLFKLSPRKRKSK